MYLLVYKHFINRKCHCYFRHSFSFKVLLTKAFGTFVIVEKESGRQNETKVFYIASLHPKPTKQKPKQTKKTQNKTTVEWGL